MREAVAGWVTHVDSEQRGEELIHALLRVIFSRKTQADLIHTAVNVHATVGLASRPGGVDESRRRRARQSEQRAFGSPKQDRAKAGRCDKATIVGVRE